MKIVISGYYGFGNVGDEAILTVLVRQLRERVPEAEIVVLSAMPTETAERFGVRAIDRWNPLPIRRELRGADAFLSGGGGLIQDETSRRSPYYYLGLIALARRYCPVYVIGQGIGPLRNPIAYRWAGRVLRRVEFALVRDEPSARLLRHWGLPADRLASAGDLAWLLWREWAAGTDESASSHHEGGAQRQSARGCPDGEDGRPYVIVALKGKRSPPGFYEAMARQLDRLGRDRDLNIIFLAFHPRQDVRVSEEVAARMEQSALVLNTTTVDLCDLLGCIGRAEALVGMRYHALLLAALTGCPFVAIGEEPKIDTLLQQIREVGGPEMPYGSPSRIVTHELELTDALSQLHVQREGVHGQLVRAGEDLYKRTRDALDALWARLEADLKGGTAGNGP